MVFLQAHVLASGLATSSAPSRADRLRLHIVANPPTRPTAEALRGSSSVDAWCAVARESLRRWVEAQLDLRVVGEAQGWLCSFEHS